MTLHHVLPVELHHYYEAGGGRPAILSATPIYLGPSLAFCLRFVGLSKFVFEIELENSHGQTTSKLARNCTRLQKDSASRQFSRYPSSNWAGKIWRRECKVDCDITYLYSAICMQHVIWITCMSHYSPERVCKVIYYGI